MYATFSWGQAPMSSRQVPVVAGIVYLLGVLLLPRFAPAGGARNLKPALIVHNVVLIVWSCAMFFGCACEMLRRALASGDATWIFCEDPAAEAEGPLYFWSYMFYISKYYEMLDTFLALLKGTSPPHFGLHVYHHTLVPLMVWNWLEQRQTLQFPGLLFNTFVHMVMYSYYAARALGWPTPWKRWVTRLQILQFATSFVLVCVTVVVLKGDLFGDDCAGLISMWWNVLFNFTLLWKFAEILFKGSPSAGEKKIE